MIAVCMISVRTASADAITLDLVGCSELPKRQRRIARSGVWQSVRASNTARRNEEVGQKSSAGAWCTTVDDTENYVPIVATTT